MNVSGKVVLITGAASGIGKALADKFLAEGARHIVYADMDIEGAEKAATADNASAYKIDVTDEQAVAAMAAHVEAEVGPIDLYVSNAGIMFSDAPDWTAISQSNEQWQKIWEVNVFSHILALRAVLPGMLERGDCGFMITASAAGLLNQIGDTSYSTTKHAALGLAESIAISHGAQMYVGVICPQAVASKMTQGAEDSSAALDGVMPAEEMADKVYNQMQAGKFMIRPHEQVEEYFLKKAHDYDRWIGGMRKIRRMQEERTGRPI